MKPDKQEYRRRRARVSFFEAFGYGVSFFLVLAISIYGLYTKLHVEPIDTSSSKSVLSFVYAQDAMSSQASRSTSSHPVRSSQTTKSAPTFSNTTQSVLDITVDLNTATAEQLDELPGIGEVKAQAIVDYREQNGPFTNIDQLLEVEGIGEKTLEKIRSNIILS